VSQNKDAADRAGVVRGLSEEGHAAMAELVGAKPPEGSAG
jgi:predicted FMN-binding regulatory protein PaiB